MIFSIMCWLAIKYNYLDIFIMCWLAIISNYLDIFIMCWLAIKFNYLDIFIIIIVIRLLDVPVFWLNYLIIFINLLYFYYDFIILII
jgi:hypothetical protein